MDDAKTGKEAQEMSSDIRITQMSFARKAQTVSEHRFNDLYYLVCKEDWLAEALRRVLSNDGARTAGVDGMTKDDLKSEKTRREFILELRKELKEKTYRPSPVRRVYIPKPGKKEKRPLGIPTIKDRVVQEVLRMLMEPIWESDALPVSHGFRPGHRTMDCVAPLWRYINPQVKFWWVIEGDISGCFDCVNHKILMRLIRRRIKDRHVLKLVQMLLKAGVMENGVVHTSEEGTPQGGIFSPMLANIYLHEFDRFWHQRWGTLSEGQRKYQRGKGRRGGTGEGTVLLLRYADDFILLTNGSKQYAYHVREVVQDFLWEELHLKLNMDKTKVTHAKDGFDFLGFHIQWMEPSNSKGWLRITPSQKNIERFKMAIRDMTASNRGNDLPLEKILAINRLLRGWIYYYRYVNVKGVAQKLDFWVNQRFVRWAKRRHNKGIRWVLGRYKARQKENSYGRNNLRVMNDRGEPVWLFKMADVPLRRYGFRRPRPNPYLAIEQEMPEWDVDVPVKDGWWSGTLPPEDTKERQLRHRVTAEAKYRCQRCERSLQGGEIKTIHMHHRVRRRKGGQHCRNNVKVLCPECHLEAHKGNWQS